MVQHDLSTNLGSFNTWCSRQNLKDGSNWLWPDSSTCCNSSRLLRVSSLFYGSAANGYAYRYTLNIRYAYRYPIAREENAQAPIAWILREASHDF